MTAFIEIFAWETDPGFALHLLNYTNPNMLRGWFTATYPVGPQRCARNCRKESTAQSWICCERERPFP